MFLFSFQFFIAWHCQYVPKMPEWFRADFLRPFRIPRLAWAACEDAPTRPVAEIIF